MAKLSNKQKKFCEEYIIDLNATQAAIRASYSEISARQVAARLLTKDDIKEYLSELMGKRSKRTEITQDRVLQELGRLAFADIRKLYRDDGSIKAIPEIDDDSAACIMSAESVEEFSRDQERQLIGYTKKIKLTDKISALSLVMRHLGMLKDKTEITGANGESFVPPIINLIRLPD